MKNILTSNTLSNTLWCLPNRFSCPLCGHSLTIEELCWGLFSDCYLSVFHCQCWATILYPLECLFTLCLINLLVLGQMKYCRKKSWERKAEDSPNHVSPWKIKLCTKLLRSLLIEPKNVYWNVLSENHCKPLTTNHRRKFISFQMKTLAVQVI